jgi:hypothetical protein
MRKFLFVVVVLGGGVFFLKGKVSLTPDNQLHVVNWTFPIPAAVQNSPLMALIDTMLLGRGEPAGASAQSSAPPVPPLPTVTTANGVYVDSRSSAGRPQQPAAAQFDTVAKALRGSQ